MIKVRIDKLVLKTHTHLYTHTHTHIQEQAKRNFIFGRANF